MKLFLSIVFLLNMLISSGQDLFKLTKKNNYEAVEAYEDAVNLRDAKKATPLMWAAYSADLKMVKLLIDKGADVQSKGWIVCQNEDEKYVYGSLMAIAAGENNMDLLKYLLVSLRMPIDDQEINLFNGLENGWTALHWAALRGNNKIIKYLLKKGANIDIVSEMDFNQTPLMFAVSKGHMESVDLLIGFGANINQLDSRAYTSLHFAFEEENKTMVKKLLNNGATLNGKDNSEIDELLNVCFGVSSVDEL